MSRLVFFIRPSLYKLYQWRIQAKRGGERGAAGGSFDLLALLAFLQSVISSFLHKIREGEGSAGPSPRSATVHCRNAPVRLLNSGQFSTEIKHLCLTENHCLKNVKPLSLTENRYVKTRPISHEFQIPCTLVDFELRLKCLIRRTQPLL